ncbi:MAG: zinc-ribbon domain-containing protein [Culicoidibacterales bacterium]
MEELQDIIIICKDCGKEFVWTIGEQEFYREKGFTNRPVRCKECRDLRKAERNNNRDNY